MSETNINKTRFNTISNQKPSNRNQKTLRQLQLSMLNIDDYEDYINKINTSLKNYQISFTQVQNEESENSLGPNEKYMDREGKELIKKIYFLNNLNINKGLPTSNDHTKLKITIPEQEYPNPFQSLGVIRSNRFLYDEICKDYLYRQSDLFNKKIVDIQKYKNKFGGGIKMPKIHISPSVNKGLFDIPVIDITDKKGTENTGITHLFPQAGVLKLFTYYKYPNKNFPEGREQFSLFMKGSEIIISGGITTNMKTLSIWGLNLEKLEWTKIPINGFANNRYGHTAIFYQNKIYFFGGKTKYQKMSLTCGLEVFNLSDGTFTFPSAGKLHPEQRRNHIAELLGSQIFIFGGITNSNEILNDCYLLNLNPLKWMTCIINKFTPGPKVFGHSSCIVLPREMLKNHKFSIYSYPELAPGKVNNLMKEKGIYIFGGKTKEEGGLSNQLWILITGKKPLEWVQPQTKGKPPSPRYFHSMSFYERGNFIIIHGGRNDAMSESSALNDTYVFDLENFDWLKVELYNELKGFKVLNRCGHQSIVYSNKLIVVGGMNNNNYLGSSLMIVNLDFSYHSKPKAIEEILVNELKDKTDEESKSKMAKIKIDLKKSHQLGIVTNVTLPPIK
jgi:N-acetylneuraminic acid mutarotase